MGLQRQLQRLTGRVTHQHLGGQAGVGSAVAIGRLEASAEAIWIRNS